MTKQISIEKHPDWYFDIPVMKRLILGSYPPHPKRYSYQFYYPHKRNHFWKILADIARVELMHFEGKEAVKERKEIMKILQAGVENMGKTIEREGESALDTKINIREFNNILGIIEKHSELEQILLPGFHAENSTTKSFMRYLDKHKIKYSTPLIIGPEQKFDLYYKGRQIQCVILNSTSPAFKRAHLPLVPQFEKYFDRPAI